MNKFEDFEIVNEDEETNFPHRKDESEENKTNFLKEVVILGGFLLCTDIYDLMAKASSEELHHVEIHTVTDRSMDSSAEDSRCLPGRNLTKSRSLGLVQRQKRKREHFSQKQQSFEGRIGSTVSNVVLNELTVLTENLDSLDDRLPPILQANATKSCLKRKKGEQTLQTSTKKFLPSLNIKPPNLKTTMGVNGSQVSHLPVSVCKQGLTTKNTSPSTENANESLSSTPHEATTFSDVSPIILRKRLLKNHRLSVPEGSPSSPRRPTPFPSIWGEDRFFMIKVGNNEINEKAKAYIVKEESELD